MFKGAFLIIAAVVGIYANVAPWLWGLFLVLGLWLLVKSVSKGNGP